MIKAKMAPTLVFPFFLLGLLASCAANNASNNAPPSPSYTPSNMPILAFPGAGGFGAYTKGGRGGTILHVTNLNDDGAGSLRWAIDQNGPRTIIFDAAGTIHLASPLVVRHPFVTIAGQSAPGGGITLAGHEFRIATSEVIVRYIRSRHGDENRVEGDAISLTAGHHIIVDHASASWSTDEALSVSQHMTQGQNQLDFITVQWSLISHSLDNSVHSKGAHGYGSLIRGSAGSRYSFHHNLWAHHHARMPRPGNFATMADDPNGPIIDFTNNVFYNWGGDYSGYNVDEDAVSHYNFVGNIFISGPNSEANFIFRESAPHAGAYFHDNWINDRLATVADIRQDAQNPNYFAQSTFENGGLVPDSGAGLLANVLAHVGASHSRDSLDAATILDVTGRTGRIIDRPSDVGGLPILASGTKPADQDGDHLPDDFEAAHARDLHLNPRVFNDPNGDPDGDGYTQIEEWLNQLAGQ